MHLNDIAIASKNRECLKEIALGSKCALLFDDGGIQEYIRGKVAEVVDKTESNLPISYRIWCMDRGVFQIRVQNQLFLLPEGYGDMPPLTVNIIISNIKPIGNERDFKCSGSLKSLLVGEVVTARVIRILKTFHRDFFDCYYFQCFNSYLYIYY